MDGTLKTYRLKNGIRLVHRPTDSEVAHLGLIVQTGTRDELPKEHGMAHFMEHMFFKGTRKKSAAQIISRLENVGGEINAYTTKEETAIHASFLKQDYLRAMELIQDIFFHSSFPEKEREKETGVILSEIQSYEDSPSELIFDRAEELLFPNHSIGRNILGSEESLPLLKNGAIEKFLVDNYATNEIVLSSAGKIEFSRIIHAAEKYYSDIPSKSRIRERARPEASTAKKLIEQRNAYQKHCMLVGEAYPLTDHRRLKLYLLNNILGGPGMNSRLNMALRERRGFSYSAESHYAPYTDTGALMVYFSCDPDQFQQCLRVTREEIRKLRTRLISENRLKHAKKQLTGQLAIAYENNEHLMLTTGKRMLVFNQVDNLREIQMKLEEITAAQLLETAREILGPDQMNVLVFE